MAPDQDVQRILTIKLNQNISGFPNLVIFNKSKIAYYNSGISSLK